MSLLFLVQKIISSTGEHWSPICNFISFFFAQYLTVSIKGTPHLRQNKKNVKTIYGLLMVGDAKQNRRHERSWREESIFQDSGPNARHGRKQFYSPTRIRVWLASVECSYLFVCVSPPVCGCWLNRLVANFHPPRDLRAFLDVVQTEKWSCWKMCDVKLESEKKWSFHVYCYVDTHHNTTSLFFLKR